MKVLEVFIFILFGVLIKEIVRKINFKFIKNSQKILEVKFDNKLEYEK